jgi:hypothetical protein
MIVQAFLDAHDGDVLSYATLSELSGYAVGSSGFRSAIQSAIKVCEKQHKLVMVNKTGVGYERGANQSRAGKAVRFSKSVFRKVRRTLAIGQTVDADDLPADQKNSFSARMAALGGARAFMHPTRIASQAKKVQNGTVETGQLSKAFRGSNK